MTRWFTRLAALIGSTMALVVVTAAPAWARPVDEHVGSTAVIQGGLSSLPDQPVEVVASSAVPVTGWLIAVLVVVLLGAGVALVVRSSHQHHMHAA